MKPSSQKKILVVDDSATMRMLLCTALKKMMVSVTEAISGFDAVNKLQEQDFDLVLTDIMMSGMDGLQLISNIRGSLNKAMPIVIISTKGREEDRDFALSLGANGYIVKPIRNHELTEVIRRFIS